MKWITRIGSIIIALCLFMILLINAIDYSVYYRPNFYKKTFEKYHVTADAKMEMSEILKVSDYLIHYLKDHEESLENFQAVVDGTKREFYSQREILHMKDVKILFGYGMACRRICMITSILLLFVLLIRKVPFIRTLVRCIVGTFLSLLGILGGFALVVSADFNRAFLTFHKIFFNNDLWLLDPEKDWVIRLLPQGFFMDMAIVILVVFSLSILAVLTACILWLKFSRRHILDT